MINICIIATIVIYLVGMLLVGFVYLTLPKLSFC